MKKYINSILLFVAIFLVCHAKAQDTVFFADGSRVLVKIIEMDNDCVKYKKWGDENGPTWVKTLGGGISVKKGVQTMSPAEKSSLFSLCNKKQNSDTKKKRLFVRHRNSRKYRLDLFNTTLLGGLFNTKVH